MSIFTRLTSSTPSARRAFSFFSHSGNGGGRFFTSARPPASIAAARGPGNSNGGRGSPSKSLNADSEAPNANAGKTSPASSTTDPTKLAPESEPTVSGSPASTPEPAVASQLPFDDWVVAHHPAPSAQDLRLHQFFSLHRPLLGISQPGTSMFDAAPGAAFLGPAKPTESALEAADAEEPSAEADAHTARQLSHALVMNRVGSAVAFDAALARLGLETSNLAVQMDSTKRKRRSKMKKHKLRKRRKLQRATRLKLK